MDRLLRALSRPRMWGTLRRYATQRSQSEARECEQSLRTTILNESMSTSNARQAEQEAEFYLHSRMRDRPGMQVHADHIGGMAISDLKLRERLRRQIELETKAVDQSVQKYRKLLEDQKQFVSFSLPPAQKVLLSWFEPLVETIREEQKEVLKGNGSTDRSIYGPYLLLLPAEKLAVIAMHEVWGLLLNCPEGVRFVRAAVSVGRAVQAEINLKRLKRKKLSWSKMAGNGVDRINKLARKVLEEEGGSWDTRTVAKMGSVLIQLLMDTAKVRDKKTKEAIPAFFHEYAFVTPKRVGFLRGAEEIFELIDRGHSLRECMHPRYMPMLVKPRPWSGPHSGGYLHLDNLIMRTRGSKSQLDALHKADLSKVFAGLNAVSGTEWMINRDIQGIVEQVWKQGGGIAEVPQRNDIEIALPPAPSGFGENNALLQELCIEYLENKKRGYGGRHVKEDPAAMNETELELFEKKQQLRGLLHTDDGLREWRKQVGRVIQKNKDLHSLRCDTEYKLQVAHEFLDETFFFPHNLDFRGRAYPIPPHLHHLGSDMCRGLLLFAKAKPLGEKGLFWLKVHLANLCGADKMSFEDRVKWTEDHYTHIVDSATKPLEGSMWWLNADEPWQCLATCQVIKKALDMGKRGDELVCHLPVHMDGSCNGLQHYAALGRDVIGAQQVNLLVADKPQDPYSAVAARVSKKVEEDAVAGNQLAALLKGEVTRKIVKQTVMTSVYGVTFVGARKQIQNRLEELGAGKLTGGPLGHIDDVQVYRASMYLARLTLNSLGDIFVGATTIMDWLAAVAKEVAAAGHPVAWTTPLGLPVVQPYRRSGAYQIKTVVQHIVIADNSERLPVSIRKQASAFPPNFVHSLDSSHMLMTATECEKRGLTFAGVHDSYWTHACDVDEMNAVLRECFVELHSLPILENLRDELLAKYPNLNIPDIPKRGELRLESVMGSPFFFD